MEDDKPLTDAEKLRKFAEEVQTMRKYQKKFFESVLGSAEKRDWLNASLKQESRVDKLVKKVLDNQLTIL